MIQIELPSVMEHISEQFTDISLSNCKSSLWYAPNSPRNGGYFDTAIRWWSEKVIGMIGVEAWVPYPLKMVIAIETKQTGSKRMINSMWLWSNRFSQTFEKMSQPYLVYFIMMVSFLTIAKSSWGNINDEHTHTHTHARTNATRRQSPYGQLGASSVSC